MSRENEAQGWLSKLVSAEMARVQNQLTSEQFNLRSVEQARDRAIAEHAAIVDRYRSRVAQAQADLQRVEAMCTVLNAARVELS